MIVYIVGLIAMSIAGFFIGGAWATFALAVSWSVVFLACWRFRAREEQTLSRSDEMPPAALYAQIDEIFVGLSEVAIERGWDIDKRLEIAGLSCERPGMSVDDLELRYDQGTRSLLSKRLRSSPGSLNNNDSTGKSR